MRKAKVLKNLAAYTASTESIKVTAQNIKEFLFGLAFYQNGATAPTLATIITHTNTVKITVQGEVETLVRFDDLYALNICPAFNKAIGENVAKPFFLVPAGDNQYGNLCGVHIPLQLTSDKDVYIEFAYSGLATIDTEKLDLTVIYGEKSYPSKPLALRYISGNTATSFTEFDISVAGKKLIGLLVYNTTIPVAATSYDFTVGELKLLVKREEKFHILADNMETLGISIEETLNSGIADNYRYIDLSEDPVPADDLKVAVKSRSAATDAFRIVGVYR